MGPQFIMIKPKQPVYKPKNNTSTRKPSLPLKRNSSIVSNASDQSCMSDRIIYKKNVPDDPPHIQQPNEPRKMTADPQDQERPPISIGSDKSLKKIKSKLNMDGGSVAKKQQELTGFQWLIVMRHCFHIENKRRSTNTIKQRTLINYIKNRMYPDSLWNKILVVENEAKLATTQVIATIEKENKWKLTLDDILVCISRSCGHSGSGPTQVYQDESAAETARFTENMKPNVDPKAIFHQNYRPQPKFICKSKQKPKISSEIAVHEIGKGPKYNSMKHMDTGSLNSFQVDHPQLGLSISPISVVDQTNDISFSLEQSQQQYHYNSQSNFNVSPNHISNRSASQPELAPTEDTVQLFQQGFTGIQNLKNQLQSAGDATEDRLVVISFLEEILGYSIYKNRTSVQLSGGFKKSLAKTSGGSQSLEKTQYFHGLKLETRRYMEKISVPILQRLFNSREFTHYFQSLQALKICEYYNELSITLPLLGPQLRILNLSHNNIGSIFFLKDHNIQNHLQFINVSNNKITNISELLSFSVLEQVHARNNSVDHVAVSKDKALAKRLRVMDLAHNRIHKEQDLWAASYLPGLVMLNLTGNSILTHGEPLGKVLNKDIITNHSEMYLFSAYTQYKDIAFSTARPKDTAGTIPASRPSNSNK